MGNVVVIGRNEGERLCHYLDFLDDTEASVNSVHPTAARRSPQALGRL